MEKRWLWWAAGVFLTGLFAWILPRPPADSPGREVFPEIERTAKPNAGSLLRPSSEEASAGKIKSPAAPERGSGSGREIPGEKILIFRDEESYRSFLGEIPPGDRLGSLDRIRAVRVRDQDWLGSQRPIAQATEAPNHYVEAPRVPLDFREKGEVQYEAVGAKALEMMGAAGVSADWGNSIVVALLDTGLSGFPAGEAEEGHATAMASLIGGASRPARGAAPGARLLDFPVLGQGGIGDAFSLAESLYQAVDQGARVINMSLGSSGDNAVVREAVAYALSKNVALVAAAGNESVNRVNYPAAYDGVVAVASVDASRQQLYFSNRGPQVSVAAPGFAVVAAWPGQKFVEVSGTSGSTALVSGAIAALLSKEPALTGRQAAQLLVQYADDTGLPGRDEETGSGVVNLQRVWERNRRGIVDLAVGGVTFQKVGSQGRITVGVQNRGTETVNSPVVEITGGGKTRKFPFGSLAPGQTRAETLTFDLGSHEREGGVPAGAAVSVRGDQRSGNDLWAGYFRFSQQK